ncbi:NAD(P)-dependent oxidoreductase [Methylocystis sp. SC2]|uniref:NAD-dependent epimerase/dehydratase family protein n=1 Tax=Methylocystis sp. (strain SC2) TaxID=187303 RepID=UPI00027AF509|nr:NAD-dependent epimerase/dehydratase family protein [Methylocystis sp. SC2]CCJ08469.1 NAD-dependent epimerase/dehydratase [Methylocystis sp. SC2]
MAKVLITGGAGFIGSHVARALVARGDDVRLFDGLIDQVHGRASASLPDDAELMVGDIRDARRVAEALEGVDAVIHLAAEVGVGQSMYAIERYVGVNDLGTAVLLQALIERPVRRVVVASSMSIYGEGLYQDAEGRAVEDVERSAVTPGTWDLLDGAGKPLRPMPTPEWKRPALASVYALTKYVQERLTLNVCGAYGMESVALRLFNVYGPGQALSNPYTGVLAIFAARLLNGRPPLVFEDGRQRRDFVHVSDVARAFLLALDAPAADGEVYNIGSGEDRSVLEVAQSLAQAMNRPQIAPEVTGKFRTGDIRHCFADISKARAELSFAPAVDFTAGLAELAEWLAQQHAVDRAEEARRELEARGLVA